jgi:hypothetical protein
MSLPIPAPRKKLDFFYLPYNIDEGYINYGANLLVRSTESWKDFRTTFA